MTAPTISRRLVLRNAWAFARQGAARFGGSVTLYIAEGFRLAWQLLKARAASEAEMAQRMAGWRTAPCTIREGDGYHGQYVRPMGARV